MRSLFTCLASFTLFCVCFGSALALRNGSVHECLLFFWGCISEMFVYGCEYFFFGWDRAGEHIHLSARSLRSLVVVGGQNLAEVARTSAVEYVGKQECGRVSHTAVSKLIIKQSLHTSEGRHWHSIGIYVRHSGLGASNKVYSLCKFLADVVAVSGKSAVIGNLIQSHND